MPKVSIRALFALLAILSIGLAALPLPRGRINRSIANEMEDGMSVLEASELIGLQPGWHDGVYGASLNLGNKAERRVFWINLNGAIIADVDGGVRNAIFVPRSESMLSYDFGKMLYDRTIQRAFDSRFAYATFPILIACFSISIAPILLLGFALNLNLTELIIVPALISFLTYHAMAFCLRKFSIESYENNFVLLLIVVSVSGFAASCLLAGLRAFKRIEKRHISPEIVG